MRFRWNDMIYPSLTIFSMLIFFLTLFIFYRILVTNDFNQLKSMHCNYDKENDEHK